MSSSKSSTKTVNVNASTIEDAFEQSGLTWAPEQSEMINSANGKVIEGKKVLYRSDNGNQLGCVGINYGVITNSAAFMFFNTICKDHGANIVKVSEYRGGSLIHIEAEVKDKVIEVRKGDPCGFKFNLWNSFDGLKSASVTYGITRYVCSNGLAIFDKEHSNNITIKHSSHVNDRLEQAIKVWAGGESWFNYFKESVNKLNQKIVDKKMVEKFLTEVFGDGESSVTTTKKETTEMLFTSGKGNGKGTAWDLLNGLSEYVDHYSKKDENERYEFANAGVGYDLKVTGFNTALAL